MGYRPEAFPDAPPKRFEIAVVTPCATVGDYWSAIHDGIRSALQEALCPGVTARWTCYNQFDIYSCCSAYASVLEQHPDAVIIGPTFLPETQDFCKGLDASGIPYVFVDYAAEGTHPMATFSTDAYACGTVMGRLIAGATGTGETIAAFESRRSEKRMSNNSLLRREGLSAFLREADRSADLVETCYTETSPDENERTLRSLLEHHPGLKGICVLNSRGSALAEALEKLGRSDIYLMSFDLTEGNVKYLRKGIIRSLLCQRPSMQGYLAASALCRHFCRQDVPSESRIRLMSVDIVTGANLDYYKEF